MPPLASVLVYAFIAVATTYIVNWLKPRKSSLPDIPAVGPSAPLLSYYGAFKFLLKGPEMMQEGYSKYKGSSFKIPEITRWHVILTTPKMAEELLRAGDDQMSLLDATIEVSIRSSYSLPSPRIIFGLWLQMLQTDYTLNYEIFRNPYHVPIVRSRLTRNLGVLFGEIRDELSRSFNDVVPPTEEWSKVIALPAIMEVVCRTSNRIFVGLPLCRDPDYKKLNIQFTLDFMKAGLALSMFPQVLRPILAYFITNVPASIARGVKHLGPLIKERYQQMEAIGGDWEGKPNDVLMWLMEVAMGKEKEVASLVIRILTMNVAAIHSSSLSFTYALYHLAANPKYLVPLREEVERVVATEGWTKAALQKMRKVDSFLRECQRFSTLAQISTVRVALKDFRFSDGTFIPAGTFVSPAMLAIHRDEEFYENPEVFNPWRFSDLREDEGEGLRHQMVSTSVEYMPFGHGKHACPGRFFAANELKGMLAHMVVTYDIKMAKEGVVPKSIHVGFHRAPDPKAEVMFRKRRER